MLLSIPGLSDPWGLGVFLSSPEVWSLTADLRDGCEANEDAILVPDECTYGPNPYQGKKSRSSLTEGLYLFLGLLRSPGYVLDHRPVLGIVRVECLQ